MIRAAVLAAFAAVCWAVPAAARDIAFTGTFIQGGLILAKADGAIAATLDGRAIAVTGDGTFVFGFGPEAKPQAQLEVRFNDGTVETRALDVARQTWRVERINGLPPAMVTPPPELLARINAENAAIAKARSGVSFVPWFAEGFTWPVTGRISGVFGSRRVLNGQERSPHWGLDVAAPTGTPVVAPLSGRVVLADPDLYYTGGTVMLDHGHGLTSMYSHLSKVSVRVGDEIKRGEALGAVGATGRVTGAHLHWSIHWFDARIDPALVVPPMPGN